MVNASEMGFGSKTGALDESLVWDMAFLSWMPSAFTFFKQTVGYDDSLWDFTYPQLLSEIWSAAHAVRVPFSPYLCRHIGPSWVRDTNNRRHF